MALVKDPEHLLVTDKVSNDDVLRRVDEDKSIISTINKRQIAWLGYKLRHSDLLLLVIEGQMEGRKPPGRPRTRVHNRIKNISTYQSVLNLKIIGKNKHTHTHTHTIEKRRKIFSKDKYTPHFLRAETKSVSDTTLN